jgi:hypothetical protein
MMWGMGGGVSGGGWAAGCASVNNTQQVPFASGACLKPFKCYVEHDDSWLLILDSQ